MDFKEGQKTAPGAKSKSLSYLFSYWCGIFKNIHIRGEREKKLFMEHSVMNSQVITSPCYLWCSLVEVLVW